MTVKKNGRKGIFYNEVFLRVISLLAAILLWLVVVINVSPNSQRGVSGVSINMGASEPYLTTLGLHIVDNSAKEVSITLSGPRNLIGRLSPRDFTVEPNYTGVTKTGTYTVPLVATLNTVDSRVHIVKVSPASISVRFDTLLTKSLPVQAVMPENYKVPGGYLLQTPQAVPSTITVSGPTSELTPVVSAVADVSVKDGLTQTTQAKAEVELLDDSGKAVDLSHMQLSSNTVTVTVPILKTAEVPLTVDFANVPAGFDRSNLNYTVTPARLPVAGSRDKIDAAKALSLGTIDFGTLELDTSETLTVPDLDGLVNVENITSAVVAVHLRNTSQRIVSTRQFFLTNVPAGRTVKVLTTELANIRLYGPADAIGSVTAVTGVVDLSKLENGTGQFEVPVTVAVPGKSGFWTTGSYNVIVEAANK